MTCRSSGGVIVCGPPVGIIRRRVLECPECKVRHRFIQKHMGAWYGTDWIGSCGDRWTSGEGRHERPFQRGWRAEAQAAFKRLWDNALSADDYAERVRADIEFMVGVA